MQMQASLRRVELTLDEVHWLHERGAIPSTSVDLVDARNGLVRLHDEPQHFLVSGAGVVALLESVLEGTVVSHVRASNLASVRLEQWVRAFALFHQLTGFEIAASRKEIILCGDLGEVYALVRQVRVHSSESEDVGDDEVQANDSSLLRSVSKAGAAKGPSSTTRSRADRFKPPEPVRSRSKGPVRLAPLGVAPPQARQVAASSAGSPTASRRILPPLSTGAGGGPIAPKVTSPTPSRHWNQPVADATTSPLGTPRKQLVSNAREWTAADWFLSPFLQAVQRLQTWLRWRHSAGIVKGRRALFVAVVLAQDRYRWIRYRRAKGAQQSSIPAVREPLRALAASLSAPLRGQCVRCLPLLAACRERLIAFPQLPKERFNAYARQCCLRCRNLVICMERWRPGAEALNRQRQDAAARCVQQCCRSKISQFIRRQKSIIRATPQFKKHATVFRVACVAMRLMRRRLLRVRPTKTVVLKKKESEGAARFLTMPDCPRCRPISDAMLAHLAHARGSQLIQRYASWMCPSCAAVARRPLEGLRKQTILRFRTTVVALHWISHLLARPRLARVRRSRAAYAFRREGGGRVADFVAAVLGGARCTIDVASTVGTAGVPTVVCDRCRRLLEPLWRQLRARAIVPTTLVPNPHFGNVWQLGSDKRQSAIVDTRGTGWFALLCASCQSLTRSEHFFGSRLRVARSIFDLLVAATVTRAVVRFVRLRNRAARSLGAVRHWMDCSRCYPIIEATSEKCRLLPREHWIGAKHRPATWSDRERHVATLVAMRKPWSLNDNGLRPRYFAQNMKCEATAAVEGAFDMSIGPFREQVMRFVELLCDTCHDHFIDRVAMPAAVASQGLVSKSGKSNALVWAAHLRRLFAHRRWNYVVRVIVLRCLRSTRSWLKRARRRLDTGAADLSAQRVNVAAPRCVASGCVRCRPVLESLTAHIRGSRDPRSLYAALLDKYGPFVCSICKVTVLHCTSGGTIKWPPPRPHPDLRDASAVAVRGWPFEDCASFHEALLRQKQFLQVAHRFAARCLFHLWRRQQQRTTAALATDLLPQFNAFSQRACCARCFPIHLELVRRVRHAYHDMSGRHGPPRRRLADVKLISDPEFDYAHLGSVVPALWRSVSVMCGWCRGAVRSAIRGTVLPRLALANHAAIRAKYIFLRIVLRRRARADAAPAGTCPHCHPIKALWSHRRMRYTGRCVPHKTIQSYCKAMCASCRPAFARAVQDDVLRRDAMHRVLCMMRTELFKCRVGPALAALHSALPAPMWPFLSTRLLCSRRDDRWAPLIVATMITRAGKPICSLPCPRCTPIVVQFVVRFRGVGRSSIHDSAFASALLPKYTAVLCSSCQRGTLDPAVSNRLVECVALRHNTKAAAVLRYLVALALSVRFVQHRRRWLARRRLVRIPDTGGMRFDCRGVCERCRPVSEVLARRVTRLEVLPKNFTEAQVAVWLSDMYAPAFCDANGCRGQRLKWITVLLKRRASLVFTAHRWQWIGFRRSRLFPRALVQNAFVKDQYDLCSGRCVAVVRSLITRRNHLLQGRDTDAAAWRSAAALERTLKSHGAALCNKCKCRVDELMS